MYVHIIYLYCVVDMVIFPIHTLQYVCLYFLSTLCNMYVHVTFLSMLLVLAAGHGRLWDPPGLSPAWWRGFPKTINYQDNELYCGGRVKAHFVVPAQFVAEDKMCTFNGTFCRTLHTLSPQNDKMCIRSRHILSPLREHRTNCYTMLPCVWCIASTLRQAFPNWPWKLYCILIKEIVDSWNYLFIIYGRISSMLLHWIPSKQDWINVGLVGNSFAPNTVCLPIGRPDSNNNVFSLGLVRQSTWLKHHLAPVSATCTNLSNNWNRKTRTISKEMKILDLPKGPDAYT